MVRGPKSIEKGNDEVLLRGFGICRRLVFPLDEIVAKCLRAELRQSILFQIHV